MENLDRLCAEYGYKFADKISSHLDPKKAENLITKALGVLQEQGLYAFLLFCKSRGGTEKEGAKKLVILTAELLKDELNLVSESDLLKEMQERNGLLTRLDDLMLSIQVLERSLIYARFHAKAMANELERKKETEGA